MKEMKNVRCAFEVYEGKIEDLVGYQKVRCHIIWNVNAATWISLYCNRKHDQI